MDVHEIAWKVVVPVAVGIFGAWLTFRIRFERSETKQEERERSRKEWRKATEKRLDKLEERLQDMADHDARLRYIEGHIAYIFNNIQKWKNDVLDKLRELRK